MSTNALLSSYISHHALMCRAQGLEEIPPQTRLAEDDPNISTVRLDDNQLTSVPEGLFQGLTELQEVFLYDNQLGSVPEGLFQGLTNLQRIDLSHNQLRSVSDGLFQGLTELQEVWLDHNQLTSVPEGLFEGLTNLQWIGLHYNQLSSVPEGLFQGLTNLQSLSLGNNQLSSVPEGLFQGLTNLKLVWLQENQLSSVPEGLFHGLTNLEELYLFHNQLRSVSDGLFQGLKNLRMISLENNQLSTLPYGLFEGLTNLQWISLDNNQLSSVPEGLFQGLTNLEVRMEKNPVGRLKPEYLVFSERDAFERLNHSVQNGDSKSVEFALTQSHCSYLQSLLKGSEGLRLFSVALDRSDLLIMKVLGDHGFPLFHEELDLEHASRNVEALRMYQEHLSFVDEKMESELADAVSKWQVFLPALAGKYRVKARLELEANDFESFFQTVDKAWLFHVRGHAEECEHLFWTKGMILQRLGDHEEARSVFQSLVSKSSLLYVSFGLYDLGLHEEAFLLLKHSVTDSRKVLSLAQASRCLVRSARVSVSPSAGICQRYIFQRTRSAARRSQICHTSQGQDESIS